MMSTSKNNEEAQVADIDEAKPEDPRVQFREKRFESVEPLRENKCTDVPCLLVFVIMVTAWSYVAVYAMLYGNHQEILRPVDSNEHRCGNDSEVRDRPYLLYHNLSECLNLHNVVLGCKSKSICVKKCPESSYEFVLESCNDRSLKNITESVLCEKWVNTSSIESCKKLNDYINVGNCTKKYVPTISISRTCFPKDPSDLFLNETLLAEVFRTNILAGIKEVAYEAYEQIRTNQLEICLCILASAFICIFFIILLRWFAGPVIWCTIIGVLGVALAATCYSFFQYYWLSNNSVHRSPNVTNLLAYINKLLDQKGTWLWIGSILCIITLILLTVFACIFSRIKIGVKVIEQGSRAVVSNVLALCFPVVPLIVQILTISFLVYIYLNLNTLSNEIYKVSGLGDKGLCQCTNNMYKNGDFCLPDIFNSHCFPNGTNTTCISGTCHLIETVDSQKISWFKFVDVFGGIWIIFFISAYNEMVLASIFTRWYWTYNKSKVPLCAVCSAVFRIIRYHLGTVAFGSFIITICRILRLMVEYIQAQCDKYPNKFTDAVLWVFRFVFWCLEKFLKFINKNAYIMCSMRGSNFFKSAKESFELVLQNGLRFLAMHAIAGCLFWISKILLAVGCGTLTYVFVHKYTIVFPSIFVGVATYFIADLFFGVYSMATSTMLLCALEDVKNNDGTEDHPYFMSHGLSKLLTKVDKFENKRKSRRNSKRLSTKETNV